MGLFGQSSPFDVEVEKATSEKNTTEPWGVIMDICDKVGTNPKNAKDCLKAIMRRMAHNDPHVVIQAVTLLDACVNNCGKNFHLEVASRDFENEFKRLLSKAQPPVASKMRLLLKKWAENDFKADPQLNLIPTLYHKLKSEGHDFSDSQKAAKTAAAAAAAAAAIKDPNVVTSEQEEEDIAKAIELSLKETKNSPKKQQQTSLYPTFGGSAVVSGTTETVSNSNSTAAAAEPRKVRALYDFEAVEENELTFVAGEIIHVQDDSDANWWKGYSAKGEGLFPSNFVTADLSVEPERIDVNQKTKKSVQFDDDATNDKDIDGNKEDTKFVPELNEEKIDRLLHLLHEANPEDPSQDTEEMLTLEDQVNQMGALTDAELERVDRKHAQLTQLSGDLVDAINLYHTLMRDSDRLGLTSGPLSLGGGGGPMSYMGPSFNPPPNTYGPSSAYGVPNMYQQQNLPVSMMGHMLPGGGGVPQMSQINQHSQHPVLNGPGPGQSGLMAPPQQIIPVQLQNGQPLGNPQAPPQQHHSQQPPAGLQSQPHLPHHQPQMLPQSQLPSQPPQIQQQQLPPQLAHQQQQMHPHNAISVQPQGVPQQQPPHNSVNPNPQTFLPPTMPGGFTSHPHNFPSNPIGGLPPAPPQGAFHLPPQQPHNFHMIPGAGMINPPPPQHLHNMQIGNHQMLPHPQQVALINQPQR